MSRDRRAPARPAAGGEREARSAAVAVAVVGHVEWVEFARVDRLPRPGEIVHAHEAWEEAAGGGAVAAVQLARLAPGCRFLTCLGADGRGRAARAALATVQGLRLEAVVREDAQRHAFTHIDPAGERTITVIGARQVPVAADPLPWEELSNLDAVYFSGGDAAALARTRGARVLVASARALETIREAAVAVDVLVSSASDAGERYEPGMLDPAPHVVVRTAGARGGDWVGRDGSRGRWAAGPAPSPIVDSYGCGDSFAAGLTFGLARGLALAAALELGARCGAACLGGRGPYTAQLSAVELGL